MSKLVQLNLDPGQAAENGTIMKIAGRLARIDPRGISTIRIIKRSVDARKKDIRVILSVEVFTGEEAAVPLIKPYNPVNVTGRREVLITGAGPAGLFAALRLIELGLKPVIIERGRDISQRKKDIAGISRNQIVDPDSNYCFGIGGAGTFSDGKLYTRSKKRGDNSRVLELFVLHGAPENILYESHPHLGTDKLPAIIKNVRKSIIDAGGIILPEKRVTGLITESNQVKGLVVSGSEKYFSSDIILATGHSSADIYSMLNDRNLRLEMKPFAMGVRTEHPQELIDRIQYHGNSRGEFLPAAAYSLVKQVDGRGVFSFCMCPGGFIVPSATSQEEVVVNGMSPSGRNSPYANSGIVVEIRAEDCARFADSGAMAGLAFRKKLERAAWIEGGRTQHAPAQRLVDFVDGKISTSLPEVSYFPGITSSPLHEWLPDFIAGRIREGFRQFGKIMKGYLTNDAVVLGVESRTSSPVRIPRDPVTMEHVEISGLYPCGEGSGYAGGIVSSAVDGMLAAEALARKSGELFR